MTSWNYNRVANNLGVCRGKHFTDDELVWLQETIFIGDDGCVSLTGGHYTPSGMELLRRYIDLMLPVMQSRNLAKKSR